MSRLTRQIHRWLSIAFVAGVVNYMALMTKGQPPYWVGLFALVPLILLAVLPYALKWRGRTKA